MNQWSAHGPSLEENSQEGVFSGQQLQRLKFKFKTLKRHYTAHSCFTYFAKSYLEIRLEYNQNLDSQRYGNSSQAHNLTDMV